ncbi:MAG: glutamine synthetase, partial [Bacteroidales bacterium]|nr:glutamine synthetase [Bacteroidales bacterium]
MEKKNFDLSPNLLERFLQKPCEEFTKADIIKYIVENNIEMLNFRYVGGDGRLKTLNFVINSAEYLDQILTTGERVDGSSLFTFIGAGSSDLYVIPKYRTAFVNPFEEIPSIDILCSYYDNNGKPLASSPENILKKAHQKLKDTTGYTFKALGELEYYIIADKSENAMFPAVDQRGYHESAPFANYEFIRKEAMHLIAQCGGKIKYGHSEVGNFTDGDFYYEQQEIEFLPFEAESAVEQLIIAKWILRKLCSDYGVNLSFAPKITVGKAGSGLHIHMMLSKNGKNMMVDNGVLSDDARKMIAGILDLADALTAFGNTIPTSYLRLVPHQEAPTNICWGDRNRSVLVRVP